MSIKTGNNINKKLYTNYKGDLVNCWNGESNDNAE